MEGIRLAGKLPRPNSIPRTRRGASLSKQVCIGGPLVRHGLYPSDTPHANAPRIVQIRSFPEGAIEHRILPTGLWWAGQPQLKYPCPTAKVQVT